MSKIKTFGRVLLKQTCKGKPTDSVEYDSEESIDLSLVKPGQCVVKLAFSPINPSDINVLEGTYVRSPPSLPAVAGMEGSGVVFYLPEDSTGADPLDQTGNAISVGDHVVAWPWNWGSWAEYKVIHTKCLRMIPKEIDLKTASMMCVNPPTAYGLLLGARKGEWIIQNAANSGMGQAIIQVAKARGIHTINVVRRQGLQQKLVELGADVVVVFPGVRQQNKGIEKEKLAETAARIKNLIGRATVKLAINAVCGLSGELLAKCLSTGGVHLTYGVMAQEPMTVSGGQLLFKDITYKGWHLQKLRANPKAYEDMWEWLIDAIMNEKVTASSIDSIFPLSQAKAAVERAFSNQRNGKVLFQC